MKTYNLFLVLTIGTIISQTIHTWFVFQSFSKLKGNLRTIQSIIFCSIISVSIFAFVIIEKELLALLGAIIEIIINIYYYAISYFEHGIRARNRKWSSILTFWRKNWIAMFFGVLLPLLIYIFAIEMMNLKQ